MVTAEVSVCVCVSGAAGCVATLLHDAAMNPAEGKGKIVLSHRLELLILLSKQQFKVSEESCWCRAAR